MLLVLWGEGIHPFASGAWAELLQQAADISFRMPPTQPPTTRPMMSMAVRPEPQLRCTSGSSPQLAKAQPLVPGTDAKFAEFRDPQRRPPTEYARALLLSTAGLCCLQSARREPQLGRPAPQTSIFAFCLSPWLLCVSAESSRGVRALVIGHVLCRHNLAAAWPNRPSFRAPLPACMLATPVWAEYACGD